MTEDFFYTGKSAHKAGWAGAAEIVRRKLDQLHVATTLTDLKVPPNNKLEALKDDLLGCYSIRINSQWRLVFRWTALVPSHVRVMDYH